MVPCYGPVTREPDMELGNSQGFFPMEGEPPFAVIATQLCLCSYQRTVQLELIQFPALLLPKHVTTGKRQFLWASVSSFQIGVIMVFVRIQ